MKIISKLKRTGGMEDIEERIVSESVLTPQDIHDRYRVLDGAIFRGARGIGTEFGHTKVQHDGALCRCGQRGCLEAYVADYALVRAAGIPATVATAEALDSLHRRAKAGDARAPRRRPSAAALTRCQTTAPRHTAAASAAAAAQPTRDFGDLRSIAFLRGTCERLVVAGEDRTESCHSALTNLAYHHGRTSFAFVDNGAQMMISFSGVAVTETGDDRRLTLDLLSRASGDGATIESEPTEGYCDYGNPRAGPTTVRCEGVTVSGRFSGLFTSDGEPPTRVEMPRR